MSCCVSLYLGDANGNVISPSRMTFFNSTEAMTLMSSVWSPPEEFDEFRVVRLLPLAAIWDGHGNRIASSTQFTFGCTTGVVAKCYRWGYRPWVTGYGDLATVHWICTRVARADYCGNGVTHTRDNTLINVWDNLPAPGPIQAQGQTPTGMLFEAGWSTGGAVCLSHARWLLGARPGRERADVQRVVLEPLSGISAAGTSRADRGCS